MSQLQGYCIIEGCERPRQGSLDLCATHAKIERDKIKLTPVKVAKPIARISPKQASIKTELQKAYAEKARVTNNQEHCSGCEQSQWDDRDHTIAQQRCKEIGKPELITNLDNFEYSCRHCHVEWEGYKSGEFRKHKNLEHRMAFLKAHDHEGYTKRMAVLELFNRPTDTI